MTLTDSFSGNDAIQAVLADIPLYAAGLLVFGISSVFLVTRRLNWSMALLSCSAFSALIASALDLSQVLSRFDQNVKLESVTGVIATREIFLALSFGMRFAFFWFFVAQPPADESVFTTGQLHSASWERWGTFGMLLKWTLALLCVAITLLQILYRTVGTLAGFGPVYEVESTAQIVVSACFTLKLVLNGYLTILSGPPGIWRWQPCAVYAPVVIALCISIAVGTGNMLTFLWSETVVGRLLQAIEYYLLVVAITVGTFLLVQSKSLVQTRKINRSSSFRGLGPMTRSTFRISRSPFADLPESQSPKPNRHSRGYSVANRLSSFLIPRHLSQRVSFPPSPADDKLWIQSDVERGLSPSLYSVATPRDIDRKVSRASLDDPSSELKQSSSWQDPLFSNVLGKVSPSHEERLANAALQLSSSPSALAIPPQVFTHSTSPSSHGDSPIHGLNDRQIPADRFPPSNLSVVIVSQRSSSYSDILHQQAELDKSIASLKLLASDRMDGCNIPEDGKPSSASQHSEFSLSHFPEPPWRTSAETDYPIRRHATPIVTVSRAESVKSHKPVAGDMALLPPQIPLALEHVRNASVPYSDISDGPLSSGRARVDSEGTQYEITSFIGHLTHKKDVSTGTTVTDISGAGTPPRGGILVNTSFELTSSVKSPLPPRAPPPNTFGLPGRPRVNTIMKLSPLAESAMSHQDAVGSSESAASPV